MAKKEFVLSHVFKDVKDINENANYFGDSEEHYHVNWRLCIRRGQHLELYLHTDIKEGSGKSALVNFQLCIPETGDTLSKIIKEHRFESDIGWGFNKFAVWKTVTDNHLIDGHLHVRADVTVLKQTGITREYLRNFGEDVKQFSDVALVVKNEKFYVSKLFLSTHSPFFATLFLGPFEESGKPEVHLKDVDPVDLQYFLEVLYGDPGVDEETVSRILKVADLYDTQIVVKKCENFLIKESEKSLKEKLKLAGKYRLTELRKACMQDIRTVADIRSVMPSNTKEMDSDILAELFDKLLAFH